MNDQTEAVVYENPGRANKAEPPKDNWGRYKAPHPISGGKEYGWQRATTMAKVLDDTHHLDLWKQRMVALGLVQRPDLLALAATVTDPKSEDGKKQLNQVTKDALEAAGASEASNKGTALHAYADHLLNGGSGSQIPVEYHPDLMAYRAELTRLGIEELPYWAERVVFNEHFEVMGRFDRIVKLPDGTLAIGDLKTRDGDLDLSWPSIAVQLATYANSGFIRNYETGQWEPMPNVRKDIALVFHLPVGRGTCHVYQVNIAAGWWGARIAAEAQQWRKSAKQVAAPFLPDYTPKTLNHPTPQQLAQGNAPAPSIPVTAGVTDAKDPFKAIEEITQQKNAAVADISPAAALAVGTPPPPASANVVGVPQTEWKPTPEQVEQAMQMGAGRLPAEQQDRTMQPNGTHPAFSSAQQAVIQVNADGSPYTGPGSTPHMQQIAADTAKLQAAAEAKTAGRPAKEPVNPKTAGVDELATLQKAHLQELLRSLDPNANVARQRKNLAAEIVRLRDAGKSDQADRMTGQDDGYQATGGVTAQSQGAYEIISQTGVTTEEVPAFSPVVSNAPGPVPPDPQPQYAQVEMAGNPFATAAAPTTERVKDEDYFAEQLDRATSKADLSMLFNEATAAGVVWSDRLNRVGIARMQELSGR